MKKRGIIATLCLCMCLAGCGSSQAEEQYEAGTAALEQMDYDSAAAAFQSTVDTGEMLPEAYRGLGIAEMNRGNTAEAAIAFSKSLVSMEDENPTFEKDVNSYLALCRTRRMEYEQAVEIYTELLAKEEDPECYFLRGKCYLATDQEDLAAVDFDSAAAISTDEQLFISIFEAYNDLQMNADGAKYLEQALSMVAQDDYYSRGLIYYYLQNYTSAKENLIQAMKVASTDESKGNAMLLLGKVYLSVNDVANARAMYQEYVNDDGLAAVAYNGLALCDIQEEAYDSALEQITKGLETAEGSARQSLLFNEICVYEYQKNWDSARQKAAEYVVAYPNDEDGLKENQFLSH